MNDLAYYAQVLGMSSEAIIFIGAYKKLSKENLPILNIAQRKRGKTAEDNKPRPQRYFHFCRTADRKYANNTRNVGGKATELTRKNSLHHKHTESHQITRNRPADFDKSRPGSHLF